jgi:small redox-active disulfide protein 2
MEIKVLGPGCANCKRLYAEAREAIVQSGQAAILTKVESMEEIAGYGVMRTPALVIDGQVASSGRIPKAREIVAMITAALPTGA